MVVDLFVSDGAGEGARGPKTGYRVRAKTTVGSGVSRVVSKSCATAVYSHLHLQYLLFCAREHNKKKHSLDKEGSRTKEIYNNKQWIQHRQVFRVFFAKKRDRQIDALYCIPLP